MLRNIPIALCLLILLAAPAMADNKRITVHVKGMACPFCTYNLEKRIKTLKSVPDKPNWTASVEKGTVTFDWLVGIPFDEFSVREQIRKAGFTPGKIVVIEAADAEITQAIKGKARFAKSTSKNQAVMMLQIVSQDNKRTVTLQADERADRRESYDLLTAVVKRREKDKKQVNVAVYGKPIENKSDRIVLYRWEPMDFGSEVIFNIEALACEQCSTRVMRAAIKVKGILHAEADYQDDLVRVWTLSDKPDIDALRKAVEGDGFKVTRVRVNPSKKVKTDQ